MEGGRREAGEGGKYRSMNVWIEAWMDRWGMGWREGVDASMHRWRDDMDNGRGMDERMDG